MKFYCKTSLLSSAFQLLAPVIPGRTPRPVLNNVKIETKENGIELLATDSEIAIRCVIPDSKVEEQGAVSIPASNIAAILRETSDDEVMLKSDGAACEIRSRDSVYKVHGDDPHNFPFVPFIEKGQSLELPASQFIEAVRKTVFSTAREKTRYALNGLLVNISGNKLEMVATDGKRLALISKQLEKAVEKPVTALVPKKAMEIVERISGNEGVIFVDVLEQVIQLRLRDVTLCGRLVEGSFPKYEEVIPKDFTRQLKVSVGPFHSAVRRAALFTSEDSKAVRVQLRENVMVVRSSSELSGQAEIELPVDYQGGEMEIAFNPEFLLDLLRVVSQDSLVFEFTEADKPVVIRAEEGYLNLVMPITSVA